MLARVTATQIRDNGIRLAAILAGAQVPAAIAKAADHSTAVAGIEASVDCVGETAVHTAITLGQTVWGMLDACTIGQMVHAAGVLIASDAIFHPLNAIAGIIGHEVSAHLVSFVFQILS
ncbi:MAG TPA: hypothetical protein VGJ06_09730 [Candidatus Acidoferrum sp.]|jgi:hypothetical protein